MSNIITNQTSNKDGRVSRYNNEDSQNYRVGRHRPLVYSPIDALLLDKGTFKIS